MALSALVVTGHGINCEYETKFVLELAGFNKVELGHLNFIVSGEVKLDDYELVVFPGGFLDGDDLGAAQACVNRIRHSVVNGERLLDQLLRFVEAEKLILGICNGFQLLVKLGLLPALNSNYDQRNFSLTGNDSGRFEDRWVNLQVDQKSPCIFTRGILESYLPVRHGEGKIVAASEHIVDQVINAGQAVMYYTLPDRSEPTMEYPWNPNGSTRSIAGLCDPTGRVFGLMPHPECYVHRTHHPRWTREDLNEEGDGLAIFRNAANYLS
jgi:phosphoribosylformylglycinamidine synthase